VEVLVHHAHPGEGEADQVEDVRDVDLGREEAGAPAQGDDPLADEGQRLLEAGGTVVAADAAREQSGPFPSWTERAILASLAAGSTRGG